MVGWILFLGSLLWGPLASGEEKLEWINAKEVPSIGDPRAQKGGTLRVVFDGTFPLTLRTVGPDSNTVMYSNLLANKWSLVDFHPNTREPIGLLATSWAFSKDGKTVYYKLDPKAKWSDGKPVVADDYVFVLEFYRSKNINAPWYNNYYTEQIESIRKIDDHTIAVTLPAPKPDMLYNTSVSPVPKHYYKGKVPKDFVMRYNWKFEPNTGPYYIDEDDIKKGRQITMRRKKDWWAEGHPYMKHRFNVEKIIFKVVREQAVQWEYFKKGDLDYFNLDDPIYWHERSKIEDFQKGYLAKMMFYNESPRSCFGIWLNTKDSFFQNLEVRKAIAHASDFDKVIKTILRGENERLDQCFQGYGEYTDPTIKARPFDLKIATSLLEKAGYTKVGSDGIRETKDGKKAEFKLLFAFDGHKDKLVVLAQEMKKAGVNMVLDYKDWSALLQQKNANRHQATYSGFGARAFGVPTFWGLFHGENASQQNTNNVANIDDPKLNKLIDQYREATDKAKRIALSKEIQNIIHDEAILIPGFMRPWTRIGYWRYWQFPKVPGTKLTSHLFSAFDPAAGGLFWFDKKEHEKTLAARKAGKNLGEITIIDETYQVKSPAPKKEG